MKLPQDATTVPDVFQIGITLSDQYDSSEYTLLVIVKDEALTPSNSTDLGEQDKNSTDSTGQTEH